MENNSFSKIKESFKLANSGKETVYNLIWWWGLVGYLVCYFIANPLIKKIDLGFIDIVISVIVVIYFSWHFYALKKCSPKKIKLSKEEKARMRQEEIKNFSKKFMKKLFLQEPVFGWSSTSISLVIDVFCVSYFLLYIFG